MIDKFCIIIDDEPQDEIVTNLTEDAGRKGIRLRCVQLNPQDETYHKNTGDENHPDFVIDLDRVLKALKSQEYGKLRADVIACDYNLQDDHVNGFEIIRNLRNQLKYRNEVILYSANLDMVIRNILSEGNLGEQIHKIRNLTRANILDFSDKDNYRAAIFTAIQQITFSLESTLESLLHKYSEWTFRSVFPPLSGKKLSEVLEEIEAGSTSGKGFQIAILENAIAHMIELNKEINE